MADLFSFHWNKNSWNELLEISLEQTSTVRIRIMLHKNMNEKLNNQNIKFVQMPKTENEFQENCVW